MESAGDQRLEAEELIASFDDRADAEAAVETLAATDLADEPVAVVGRDVVLVEQATRGWSFRRALLEGAAAGAAVGAVFGFAAGSFNWVEPLVSALALAAYGLVLGTMAGAAAGLVLRGLSGRGHNPIPPLRARRYDLVADPPAAAAARRSLSRREAHGL